MHVPIDAWTVESCRVTLFTGEAVSLPLDALFSRIANTAPDSVSMDRKMGQSVASGLWKAGQLQIVGLPGRLDFNYGPQPPDVPDFVCLEGSPVDRFVELASAVGAWIADSDVSPVRLALGSRCLQLAETREDAYRALSRSLGIVAIDHVRFRELQLRVNYPVMSKVEAGLAINRLTGWSAITMKKGVFTTGGTGPLPVSQTNYCVCELDINTDPERKHAFDRVNVASVLAELCDNARLLLTEGVQK